jgi:hypothetical protein
VLAKRVASHSDGGTRPEVRRLPGARTPGRSALSVAGII